MLAPDRRGRRLEALDVGCGPGLVMEELGPLFTMQGLDRDKGMVEKCHNKGLMVVQGEAEGMPFEDNSFDVVYCSFLLLWVKEPSLVIKEMIKGFEAMGGMPRRTRYWWNDPPSQLPHWAQGPADRGHAPSRGGPFGGKEIDRIVTFGRSGPRGRGSPWRLEGRFP